MNLNIANCCGTCFWANGAHTKKREIETHAAHYMVAKTERWCLKHNAPTVREAICDNGYEADPKKGGAPAVKRARKQNERLDKIIKCKEYIDFYGSVEHKNRTYIVSEGKLCYRYDIGFGPYQVSCKENSHDDFLNEYSQK